MSDCPLTRRDAEELLRKFLPRAGDVRGPTLRRSERAFGTVSHHTFPRTAALERTFAGPGSLVYVYKNGDPAIDLTFVDANGRELTLPAITGARYAFPFRSCAVDIPVLAGGASTQTGELGIYVAGDADAFAASLEREWLPFFFTAGPGAGNATLDVPLPVTGAEYDIDGVTVELVTDATVATRSIRLLVNDQGGNAVTEYIDRGGQAASITGFHNWIADAGVIDTGATLSNRIYKEQGMIRWRGRVPAAANHFQVVVASGQAGDAVTARVQGRFRRL